MMRFPKGVFLLMAVLVLALAGCNGGSVAHSPLFDAIVQPEKGGTFRGVRLGMKLEDVQKVEGMTPRHNDMYGFVYEEDLGESRKFYLEYICKANQERVVNSIVGNVFLKDAAEASSLYDELEAFWRGQYGVADGPIGEIQWKDTGEGIWLSLRILEDKKSISFNFVPVTGF